MVSTRKLFAVFLTAMAVVTVLPGLCSASHEAYEIYIEKGLDELNAGDLESAKRDLGEANNLNQDSVEALFYLGQAYWRSGDVNKGTSYFEKVYVASPDSDFGKVAKKYLDSVREKRAKRYYLNLYTGPQYDSNVVLKPASKLVQVKKKVDWSWMFYMKSGYSLPIADGLALNATYNFYLDRHSELGDFDIQDHELHIYPSYSKGPFVGMVAYNFRYTLLGGHSFEQVNGVSPKLRFLAGPRVTVEAYYTYADKEFYGMPDRDAVNNRYSLDGYYYFMNRQGSVKLGYYHEDENALGRQWDFDGYGLVAGLSVPLPLEMRFTADGEYQHRHYGKGFNFEHGDIRDRKNNNTRYTLALSKQFDKNIGVLAAFTKVNEDSTFSEFHYNRVLTTVLLTAKF